MYHDRRKLETHIRRTDGEYWRILDFRFLEGGPYTEADNQNANFVAVITEFGRTPGPLNGVAGRHHYNNAYHALFAGAGVKGGSYYGRWPGLQNTLDADVQVTTDYRSVLAEVIASRTTASTAKVFPGFTREHVGVMAGQ